MKKNVKWSSNPLGMYREFFYQRFNVNVTELICSSSHWENDYSLMSSYHSTDENWQRTLVELTVLCKCKNIAREFRQGIGDSAPKIW